MVHPDAYPVPQANRCYFSFIYMSCLASQRLGSDHIRCTSSTAGYPPITLLQSGGFVHSHRQGPMSLLAVCLVSLGCGYLALSFSS